MIIFSLILITQVTADCAIIIHFQAQKSMIKFILSFYSVISLQITQTLFPIYQHYLS